MILFPDKKDCCNCNACTQICPKDAISSHIDKNGFVYPRIDHAKCIECGLCQKVCAYQHIKEVNTSFSVYAAVSNNKTQTLKSASGGIFAALATYVLERGGVVYGVSMTRTDGKFIIQHIGITAIDELPRLQGSKYVQSKIGNVYKDIGTNLKAGKTVLFSGTPCQCAGLKGFLMGKEFPNLYIVDVICHGVPSQKMFNDYINYQFSELKDITNFSFRDKSKGWELAGRVDYDNGTKCKFVPAGTSSYYSLFLSGQIYRVNCYSCKYACIHRPGDLTIGDYWGIQHEHPELLKSRQFKLKEGISCIIVNTLHGERFLKLVSDYIKIAPSTYDKVARRNGQLLYPTRKNNSRDQIFSLYKGGGYHLIDQFYRRSYRTQRLVHSIFSNLPYWMKGLLRNLKH